LATLDTASVLKNDPPTPAHERDIRHAVIMQPFTHTQMILSPIPVKKLVQPATPATICAQGSTHLFRKEYCQTLKCE